MERTIKAILGMAMLPVCLFAQQTGDTQANWDKELNLNEVVVVGERTVLKQSPDRIVYLTRNDPFAKGLNGMEVLDRMPRVSVTGDLVNVAGKSSVRYIVDGRLLDIPDNAIAQQLKNLQASGIEKIELLTTPPAKYAAGTNVAYISITTREAASGAWAAQKKDSTICLAETFRTPRGAWNCRLMPAGRTSKASMTSTAAIRLPTV